MKAAMLVEALLTEEPYAGEGKYTNSRDFADTYAEALNRAGVKATRHGTTGIRLESGRMISVSGELALELYGGGVDLKVPYHKDPNRAFATAIQLDQLFSRKDADAFTERLARSVVAVKLNLVR